MKRRFTVFTLLVLMLVFAAALANAKTRFPSALDGSTWGVFGFQFNATEGYFHTEMIPNGLAPAVFRGDFNATENPDYFCNASVRLYSSTNEDFNATKAYEIMYGLGTAAAGETDASGVPVTFSLSNWNATVHNDANDASRSKTSPYYLLATPGYKLAVGLSNATANATYQSPSVPPDKDKSSRPGSNMIVMLQNATLNSTTMDGTWYFYTLVSNSSTADVAMGYRVGKIEISNYGTASQSVTGTWFEQYNDPNKDTVKYTKEPLTLTTNGQGEALSLSITATGASMVDYMVQEKKSDTVMVGYSHSASAVAGGASEHAEGTVSFTVAMKDARVISSQHFNRAGMKFVSAGAQFDRTHNATSMLGWFVTDSTSGSKQVIGLGNATIYNSTGYPNNDSAKNQKNVMTADLSDFGWGVGSANLSGVIQSNATLYDTDGDRSGSFIGRWNDNREFAAGIWIDTGSADNDLSYQFMFMIPDYAVVDSTFQNSTVVPNAFKADPTVTWTITGTNATTMTIDEIEDSYTGVPGTFVPLMDKLSFSAQASQAGSVITVRIPFTNLNIGSINDLRLLKDTGVARLQSFTYNQFPSSRTVRSKQWWLTADDGTTVVQPNEPLYGHNTYYLYVVIEDGDTFDTDGSADAQIEDPILFGRVIPLSDDDDTTGCVFNPAAGFGLEWLLLLLAPGLALVRNRRK